VAEKPAAGCDAERAALAAKAVLTTCPFCSCGCGLYLHADQGVLAGVAPSEHHPVSQGRLCARGWAAHEAPAWGERLTQPLIRRNDALEPVGWEEALARAAEGLKSALGSGVGVLGSPRATNEESFLLARMARVALGTGNVDSALRVTYQPLLDGLAAVGGQAAVQGTLSDLEASDVVLLVEGNLTHTHTRVGLSVLRAVKQGARLVTLGPARTQFARLAALHVPVVPGRERETLVLLVAAALAAREGGAAAERLAGEEALRESLAGQAPGDAERRVAAWFARAGRASVVVAPTAAPAAEARETARTLASFLALTGHLGRPGSAVLVLPARGNLRGACELGVLPDRLPGARDLDDVGVRGRLRTLWGREPSAAVGLDAWPMLERVSALLAFAEDPPSALPASGAARSALERLRCLVVLDAFLTPTARQAHVVLPIAAFGETDGTVTSLEGRLQRVSARVSPPGSARPGWRVLADLLERLGVTTSYRSAAEVLAEIAGAVPAYAVALEEARQNEWGGRLGVPPDGRITLGPLDALPRVSKRASVLAWEGVLDWGSDPLASFSPTLRRDEVSRRKLYPRGLVGLNVRDAEQLGVRSGGPVRLSSASGETVLTAQLRADLEPGVLLVPYVFREFVAGVTGGAWTKEVRLTRG
jgi:predicted molibdopterin-dependent oxidoreductase YjgC